MRVHVAVGVLLMAILAVPTAGLAVEAFGQRHWIPCVQCAPDVVESVHVARSTGAASITLQLNFYDTNGISSGAALFIDPAGTFLAQQIAFTTSAALAQAGLPSALWAGVLFNSSNVTNVFYEQIAINAQGVAGILTGRGDGYNYFSAAQGGVFALTLVPEGNTGLSNFFTCNNPANNMATFLGITGPGVGAQAVASLITTGGNQVLNNFPTQNLFRRPVGQINAAGTAGGSLFLFPPTTTKMACVKAIVIQGLGTVVGYTY
jgi:hypothetical protein